MVDGSLLPVVAGLVIGITFVVLFSTMLKPIDAMTDDELRHLVANQYPQFQALKERYPDTTVEEIERHERGTDFRYVATKEPRDDSTFAFPGPKVLAITLTIEPLSPMTLNVICGSGLTTNLPATVQSIKTTDCLEVGVFESDPTGGELNGGVFLSIENDVDRNNSNVAISFSTYWVWATVSRIVHILIGFSSLTTGLVYTKRSMM